MADEILGKRVAKPRVIVGAPRKLPEPLDPTAVYTPELGSAVANPAPAVNDPLAPALQGGQSDGVAGSTADVLFGMQQAALANKNAVKNRMMGFQSTLLGGSGAGLGPSGSINRRSLVGLL
jgi:hypothetical protein